MYWLPGLLQLIVLFGGTGLIIGIDKAIRRSRETDDAIPLAEPSLLALVLLTLLCNIAALPYYFYSTRRNALWGLVGFVLFAVCMGLSVAVYTATSLVVL